MSLLTAAVQTLRVDAAYFHGRTWSLLRFTWLHYERSVDGVNTLFLEHMYGLFCPFPFQKLLNRTSSPAFTASYSSGPNESLRHKPPSEFFVQSMASSFITGDAAACWDTAS